MWPDKIIRQFATVPANPSEVDFHGPYNKLLNTLFPADTDFVVVLRYYTPPDGRCAADAVFMFEILLDTKPVLILQLVPPQHLEYISKRRAADEWLRVRMADLRCERHPCCSPRVPCGSH